jgi:hypothetical protein
MPVRATMSDPPIPGEGVPIPSYAVGRKPTPPAAGCCDPLAWSRSAKGNLWRPFARVPGDGGVVTVFHRWGAYAWCIKERGRPPRFSRGGYATEAEAIEATVYELADE